MLRTLWKKFNSYLEIPNQLKTIKKEINELRWADIFTHSIQDIPWINSKNFSPSGASANYSFLYILFRILNDTKPRNILEFGIGQTTKLTSQFVAEKNNKISNLIVVEHDQIWVDHYLPKLAVSPFFEIILYQCREITFKGSKTVAYENIKESLKGKKFDLIINDGPGGSDHYSRIHLLELLEYNLADEFIILIDDVDRHGESQTTMEVINRLIQLEKKVYYRMYSGSKSQYLIFSPKFIFLREL